MFWSASVLVLVAAYEQDINGLIVQTQLGAVQGKTLNNKAQGFFGMRYAQPPVGKLRFRWRK
jgi:hypothetical protein